uniref:Uncharacterized protein n=1 Tax=Anguilla anguilla TaxID=7936 RepID=A0A0E9VG90_ANGAN
MQIYIYIHIHIHIHTQTYCKNILHVCVHGKCSIKY